MKHRSLASEECAVSRSLEQVGQWWTIPILRNVLLGMHRFGELEETLSIAPTTLSRRLREMQEHDLLTKNGERYELTEKGSDFLPVIMALVAWGHRWTRGGKAVVPVWTRSGQEIVPHVVDKVTGRALTAGVVSMASGPEASDEMRALLTPRRPLGERATPSRQRGCA